MKVLFLHGLNSNPGGSKAQALLNAGYDVFNPALDVPFKIAVEIAQNVINSEKPQVIVGSSRGGAVAMAVDAKGAKRVLIAPAWKKYGVPCRAESAIVLHSKTDNIILFKDTEMLLEKNPNLKLIICDDNHRMKKEETLQKIVECVNNCANK